MNPDSWRSARHEMEKRAFQPTQVDFYTAIGGPFGALAAPSGDRLATALGGGAGMWGGYRLGNKALEMIRAGALPRYANKLSPILARTGALPLIAGAAGGAVLGGRLARHLSGGDQQYYGY